MSVSVMIFTLNEELHLPSCLDALAWCDDVIVVDSFSTDRTEEICRERDVRFFQNRFEGFGKQRNWALVNTEPKHEWILILDADERVTPELRAELDRVLPTAPDYVAAYRLKRRFYMWGRWLRRSSLYPTWVVRVVRRGRVRYVNRGHAETQEVDGDIETLEEDLIDENKKGIEAWLVRQAKYARKEAEYELREQGKPMRAAEILSTDPLARRAALKRMFWRMPGRSAAYFAYSYLLRGGFTEGRDGLTFCVMKSLYQQMIVATKYELAKLEESNE